MLYRPVSRRANVVVRELENEVLLYDLTLHKAYCLNPTSALVFQFCDGSNSVAAISDLMSKELKTLVNEDLVWLALKQLKQQNLLEPEEAITSQVTGFSRRELLKKARLSSLVMLPAIVAIVAPTAVMAASCINFLSPCVPGPNRCCPGSICDGTMGKCGCKCTAPGDCFAQTGCPNTNNCNGQGVCAP
jgi:hypothetical protein